MVWDSIGRSKGVEMWLTWLQATEHSREIGICITPQRYHESNESMTNMCIRRGYTMLECSASD